MKRTLEVSEKRIEDALTKLCDSHLKLKGFEGYADVSFIIASIKTEVPPKPEPPKVEPKDGV